MECNAANTVGDVICGPETMEQPAFPPSWNPAYLYEPVQKTGRQAVLFGKVLSENKQNCSPSLSFNVYSDKNHVLSL